MIFFTYIAFTNCFKVLINGKRYTSEYFDDIISMYGKNIDTIRSLIILEGYFNLNRPLYYNLKEYTQLSTLKISAKKDNFDAEVKIKMPKKEGEITSIYPVIKEEDHNTWIVKANKNGEIIHNNRKHNYLFWECLFTNPFQISEGFVIEGHECFEFFEEKLQYLGFKESEANDFITYWCPKMEHSKYVAICFQGEEYEKRVPLIVEPKPDYIKRVFMTFKLLDEKITLPLQDIEQFKIKERKGFFVFE